ISVLLPAPKKLPPSNSETLARALWRFLLAAAVFVSASATSAQEVPIPPAPERWVTDRAGLLSPAARARLDAKLESYERQTGHQVVVWIGESIGSAALDDFAVKTFKAWQLG